MKQEYPPGAYMHDAAEISRAGRNWTALLGGLALFGDGLTVVGDMIGGRSTGGDILYMGETGLIVAAGTLMFHVLHKTLGARAKTIADRYGA